MYFTVNWSNIKLIGIYYNYAMKYNVGYVAMGLWPRHAYLKYILRFFEYCLRNNCFILTSESKYF